MWLQANHALGMPHDGTVDFDTDDYLGRSCYAKIIVSEWKGKDRNEVDDWYTPEEGAEQAPPPEQSAPPPEPTRSAPRNPAPPARPPAARGGRRF